MSDDTDDDTDEVDPNDWFSDKRNPPRDAGKPDATPAWPLTEPPAAAAQPTGGFQWGLTPSMAAAEGDRGSAPPPTTPEVPPMEPPPAEPTPAEPTPATPPPAEPLPVEPPAPWIIPPAHPAVEPPPILPPPVPFTFPPGPPAPLEPGSTYTGSTYTGSLDTESVAIDAALEGPPPSHAEPPTVALPWETTIPEFSATESETELLGTGTAEADGSDIDSLFAHERFTEHEDAPLIPALTLPFARSAAGPVATAEPGVAGPATAEPGMAEPGTAAREPISRNQRILLWAAGGAVAILALVVLFLVGTKLPGLAPAPQAAVSTSASPTSPPTSPPVAAGPVAVGGHKWNELRGGECLDPFTSPWAEKFTVVDCAAPHPAQLVLRGTFPAAAPSASATPAPTGSAGSDYPGAVALQAQINLLCTAPGVINLGVAGAFSDIQFQASYAATAGEWAAGQHDYFCFVNRSAGEPLTGSLAGAAG